MSIDITITIPTEYVSRAADALVGKYDYEETKLEGETENQFALRVGKQIMIKALKKVVYRYEDSLTKPTHIELI